MRILYQTESAECGLICLAMVSEALGARLDLTTLRRKFPTSARGLTLASVLDLASQMGLSGRAVRCEVSELRELKAPAILHWDLNHFVVLERVTRKGAIILDPALGRRELGPEELSDGFTGVALELHAAPLFRKRRERSALPIANLLRWSPKLTAGLVQAIVLSIVLQAYVLASPLYLKLAIDEAVLKADNDLLTVLAVGFGLFALFNAGAEVLRGIVMQRVSAILSWEMTGRLFAHLMHLPLPWFQRRRLADVLSRFDSLGPINELISNGLIVVLIDGVLSITVLICMFIVSPALAAITAGGLVLALGVQIATIPLGIRFGMQELTASVSEQGRRIEAIRAIQTIKLMGAETKKTAEWANRYAEAVEAKQSTKILQTSMQIVQRTIDAVIVVLIVWLGSSQIIAAELTIGTFYAFLSYRTQFSTRAQSLVQLLITWRMLDLHTHRLADVALASTEAGLDRPEDFGADCSGAMSLSNVAYRYGAYEPFVLRDVSLHIEEGSFVAISGPSGVGKSTLLKIMCGLYVPTAGAVLLDGISIQTWGNRTVRAAISTVMQDDELLSGSIAENVAFFSDKIDRDRVWKVLRDAGLEGEVRKFPMNLDTQVGDMGSALSGGQKQRVLLARALYKEPKILILDEATSHLDGALEKSINDTLRGLGVTRIVVAHRYETISAADRVLHLDRNGLREVRQGGLPVIAADPVPDALAS